MSIKHKIAEYFGLIDSYERIIVLEQKINDIQKKQAKRYPHLIKKIDQLEKALGVKDSYIESVIKNNKE